MRINLDFSMLDAEIIVVFLLGGSVGTTNSWEIVLPFHTELL